MLSRNAGGSLVVHCDQIVAVKEVPITEVKPDVESGFLVLVRRTCIRGSELKSEEGANPGLKPIDDEPRAKNFSQAA
jgi:hypothetical protein